MIRLDLLFGVPGNAQYHELSEDKNVGSDARNLKLFFEHDFHSIKFLPAKGFQILVIVQHA